MPEFSAKYFIIEADADNKLKISAELSPKNVDIYGTCSWTSDNITRSHSDKHFPRVLAMVYKEVSSNLSAMKPRPRILLQSSMLSLNFSEISRKIHIFCQNSQDQLMAECHPRERLKMYNFY